MFYSTDVFTYTPRRVAVTLSGNSPRKFLPVYSKPLLLHRGVDNKIQFRVLDQNQKPIDTSNSVITFRAINDTGNYIILETTLNNDLPLTGICSLNVSSADTIDLVPQKCYYTLEINNGVNNYPVFVDQSSYARGELEIVDSILPTFSPSTIVTIPSGQSFPNAFPNVSIPLSSANSYYSSAIHTVDKPTFTLQATYNEYNGNVAIQGSTSVMSGWYDIQDYQYANTSNTVGYTVEGFHPYIRMEFTSNAGSVTNLYYR